MLPMVACAALEKTLNQCLRLDPESMAKVTALEGKAIAIQLLGLELEFFLIPTHDGLRVQSVFEGEPDVRIKGGPVSLARMGLGQSEGLLGEGIEFEGDASLGRKVQAVIDGLDLDWEEQLSRVSGDVIAHQVGNFFRSAADWGKHTGETLAQDVVEYFQEESRDLVTQSELNQYLDGVDVLRSDIDRMTQRVQRLVVAANAEGEQ